MGGNWTVRSITRALLPILLVLTLLELVAGLTLGSFVETLLEYPTILILVPVVIGTAGNLGSVLAARLSTAVHLGILSFDPDDEQLLGNSITTVLLAVSVFPLVGAGGWVLVWLTGEPRLAVSTVVVVTLTSGLILAGLAIALTITATYTAYYFELDPDDVVIPVVTNVCDVLGVVVLFAVLRVTVI